MQYRIKTIEQIQLLRDSLEVNEKYEERDLKIFLEETLEFINDQKQLMVHLQSFNERLRSMLPIKQAEKEYYKQFSIFLSRYEETKNKKSGQKGELAHVQLISGDGQDNLKAKLEAISSTFKNPFIYISNWIK